MSASALAPGARTGVTRHLGHLKPPAKGSKFTFNSSRIQHTPNFVHPRDRIAFWNIVPGDEVRLRAGRVGENLGYDLKEKLRGEGKVISVDKKRNLAWLVNIDELNPRAPTNIKHVVPRIVDPDDPSKGFSNNTLEVARPVHYSNLMLRIPSLKGAKEGETHYAVRLERKNTYYSRFLNRWVWQRFAIIRNDDGTTSRIHVPWPEAPYRANQARPDTAGKELVNEETWLPWSPSDPVHLTPERPWSSAQSEAEVAARRAELARAEHAKAEAAKEARGDAHQRRLGMYAGFVTKSRPKRLPVPQPPTASELLSYSSQSLSVWASALAVREHVSGGGKSFAPADYLDFAPTVGPAAGGDWALPLDPQGFKLAAFRRDSKTGKLVAANSRGSPGSSSPVLSKAHFDSMPVEILMESELSNPHGLKARRRRREQKQALLTFAKMQEAKEDDRAIKALRKHIKAKMMMQESTRRKAEEVISSTAAGAAALETSATMETKQSGAEESISEAIATQAGEDLETDDGRT